MPFAQPEADVANVSHEPDDEGDIEAERFDAQRVAENSG
jgi:hypothetical protein